ncbi:MULTISPECIES: ATP-grasp domain-containing protein [Staphylococcus]|uniref:ATP-grasp domain-containing protein n=1 Tax=Staphylococcus haemolyticus (strain JCSC1435) TaxID=279808 RepID=Q4L9I3_STAHJ|nr:MULTISPECIES: ATP-grasp domain-containing protein [Staphylococcus]AYX84266.1 ATP-grasp domain-containing protein [Staphylococcus haemolyticus]MBW3857452.1 ATP-grasp domain-containing protein [Staphylococcus haemolyticus]MBW5902824.1 ATP-grasp domain-containing protein [Staphylococcus haemolyticus]MCH4417181.1 ATP-grasp domain-containing protein [Staphylococcus haemolyticus]MCH4504065.1 ATP-grasp domain-containing protein [Staphylococcus haemolyticus]
MNILILSAGTRNKVVQFFKKEFTNHGNVICTDMSELAPAIYEGVRYYITPSIKDPNYLDIIIDICKREKINGVLSLIDPELELLAQNKNLFEEIDVKLLQSDLELISTSFNKFNFYNTLKSKGFNSQLTVLNSDEVIKKINTGELKFPVFVKPNSGSASLNINKVNDLETLTNLLETHNDLIVQEFIDGKEYGVDVYVDFISKEVTSIFIKEKIKMRAGETDKSISVINNQIFKLIEQFVSTMGYVGQIDIDLFEANGQFYISEVNPRFGGGYPHAYLSGCNFPQFILNNLQGKTNKSEIGAYKENTIMMKYNEIKYLENK